MVNYNCIRCGYETNDRSKMKAHLSRKNVCKPLLNDVNLDEYKKDILNCKAIQLSCMVSNSYKPEKNGTDSDRIESIQMSAIVSQNVSVSQKKKNVTKCKSNEAKKEYNCEYCKKNYNHRQSLHKHLKICKEKMKDEECKSDMLELIKKLNEKLDEQQKEQTKLRKEFKLELDKKDDQINELIKKTGIQNSNITNNIQQNIKILAYKNSDISHLTDKDFIYCFNRSNMCVPHLIKKIHFNPTKPENHNVYISNIKNKYAMVYDGNKWNLNNQDETIGDLIDINEGFLEQKLEEWLENGKEYPEIMKKFNRYLEKKENDEVINKIKEEIKLILYNNRKDIDI
jgi:hypothetical protein